MVKNHVAFILSSVLVAGVAMLLSMMAGELLVRQDLFGGFTREPGIWPLIILESAVWVAPVALIGALILRNLTDFSKSAFGWFSAFVWFLLGTLIVISYKWIYFPSKPWRFTDRIAETMWGWIIPCSIIWIAMTYLSYRIREPQPIKIPRS